MSAGQAKFPKNPVPARKVHQRTQIVGKNGLTVDAQATLEPGSVLTKGATTYTYNAPTVTFDPATDLSSLLSLVQNAKHTGVILFTDGDSNSYFVDAATIDDVAKTIDVYIDPELTNPPSTLDGTDGWLLSEAELVNRLQTTTTAVIDNVEFRDISINVDLDGSTVNIKDDDGDQLEINPDGSINVKGTGKTITVYNEPVTAIPSSTPTTIVTYTAPADKISYLQSIMVSGENIAEYEIKVNGVTIAKKRTYFPKFDTNFDFLSSTGGNGRDLAINDIVTVVVTHFRPVAGKFNSTILSLET